MPERLIDANALIQNHCGACANKEFCAEESCPYYEIRRRIENSPTVDAVTVKHGRWILIGRGRITKSRDLKCSVCGNYFRVYDDVTLNAGRGDANFCPNCGAKMD